MHYELIKEFYPDYLLNTDIEIHNTKILLYFKTSRTEANCPNCGELSKKFTSYYKRKIQDLPIIDKQLFLMISLKKFRCNNKECKTRVFTESIIEIARKSSRKTNRLEELLTRISLTNSAEEGSRLCKNQNIEVSGDTLLRLSKKWEPSIDKNEITAVGVDDFALKKNIDMEQL